MIIPQISIGKAPSDPLNIVFLLPLPPVSPFGNLHLKFMKVFTQCDRVNLLVQKAFHSYWRACSEPSYQPIEHSFILEEVVYWIRKTVDELLSLAYVMHEKKVGGSFPAKVEVDCIGRALNASNNSVMSYFESHRRYLTTLNEVSNAYKHSFLNSDITLIGRDEPCVFALALRQNDLTHDPQFIVVSARELVEGTSRFYCEAKKVLSDLNGRAD